MDYEIPPGPSSLDEFESMLRVYRSGDTPKEGTEAFDRWHVLIERWHALALIGRKLPCLLHPNHVSFPCSLVHSGSSPHE